MKSSVGEEVQELKMLCIFSGNKDGLTALENNLEFLIKVHKHHITQQF